jgi:hypothetical protein
MLNRFMIVHVKRDVGKFEMDGYATLTLNNLVV